MKRVLFVILLMSVVAACKKKEVEVEQKPILELLTNNSSKTWKIQSGTANQNGLQVNLVDSQNPCVTDNEIVLFSDFGYEFKEGASKCASSDPDLIIKATWSLSEDNKTMSIERLFFLNRVVEKPVFEISEVTEESFSGKSNIEVSGEKFEIQVVFGNVK